MIRTLDDRVLFILQKIGEVMKIKKERASVINICKYCIYSYRKINIEPCCSCIEIVDKEFNYKKFKKGDRKVKK